MITFKESDRQIKHDTFVWFVVAAVEILISLANKHISYTHTFGFSKYEV